MTEKLLWTPEEISESNLIPYSAKTIRRFIQEGRIRSRRMPHRRVLVHIDAIKAFAATFLEDDNQAQAGPHASEEDPCRENQKTVSTKETTRSSFGRRSRIAEEGELGALLESGKIHQAH